MAISKGKISQEELEYKRFIGVCPVTVIAFNPTKAEHEKLFGTTLDTEPVYITDKETPSGIVRNVRLNFILKPVNTKVFQARDIPLISMNIFISQQQRMGSASGKIQVIDKYGNTAWATQQDLAAHSIPMYSNGPANIDKDYRPCYQGEEDLIAFIKAYLSISDTTIYDNDLKRRVKNTFIKPEECECSLEHIENLFKGDFSEVKDAIPCTPNDKVNPDYKVKVMLGIRTTDEGKMYQNVYTKVFLKNNISSHKAFQKEIDNMVQNANNSGRALSTMYESCYVHEYVQKPTTFDETIVNNSNEPPIDSESFTACPWE